MKDKLCVCASVSTSVLEGRRRAVEGGIFGGKVDISEGEGESEGREGEGNGRAEIKKTQSLRLGRDPGIPSSPACSSLSCPIPCSSPGQAYGWQVDSVLGFLVHLNCP